MVVGCKHLGLACLLLLSAAVMAEEAVIPNPMAMGFSTRNLGYERVSGSDTQVGMQRTTLVSPLAKVEMGEQLLVPGIAIERTLFRLNNTNLDDQAMYQVGLPIGLFRIRDDDIRLLSVAPSIHTDGNIYDEGAFSLNVIALWQNGLSQKIGYRWGLAANRLFGRYQAYPVAGVQIRPTAKTELDIGLPFTKFEYNFSERWNTFLNLAPSGGDWRYKNEQQQSYRLSYSSWILTAGLRYRTFKRLWVSWEAGRSINRHIELTDDDGNSTESSIHNTHFFLVSFGLHP